MSAHHRCRLHTAVIVYTPVLIINNVVNFILGVVPGLNPNETLVAEDRLFPPMPSSSLLNSSNGGANAPAQNLQTRNNPV